eukprot:CCRYP_010504-RA/>CCRYP_010504-RA protein AED:0.01 eAED:0.01 QI:303/1/1/1/1/1/2/3142/374
MRPSTTSSPISIPASEPIAIHPRRRNNISNDSGHHRSSSRQSGYSSSSSTDDEGRNGSSALSSAMERTDSLGDLRVGSLPMHLRRSGRAGSRQRQLSGGAVGFFGPQSLPPPRAPFLSSRGGPEGNLSSIPDMVLPESAASTDPTSSSVPYGSLRESKFSHPGFGIERMPGQISFGTDSANFQPQSLPAYSGSHGIGSYFNMNNDLSRESSNSGIGSLLEESEEYGRMRHSETDSVSGISQAFSSGLQLNVQDNPGDTEAGKQTAFPPSRRHVRTTNDDPAPLSSSLTALDILKQIRQSPNRMTPMAHPDNRALDANNALQLQRQQIQHGRHWHEFDSSSPNYDEAALNSAHDDKVEDNNPDTFEAFDFDLDDE